MGNTILQGILARNVQKVCKIAENSISGNVKSGFTILGKQE